MPAKSDLLQGTLAFLILRTLAFGPHHGLGVSYATHDADAVKTERGGWP